MGVLVSRQSLTWKGFLLNISMLWEKTQKKAQKQDCHCLERLFEMGCCCVQEGACKASLYAALRIRLAMDAATGRLCEERVVHEASFHKRGDTQAGRKLGGRQSPA